MRAPPDPAVLVPAVTAPAAASRRSLRLYNLPALERLPQLERLSAEERFAIRVVGQVLPVRCNNYVVEELIDWEQVPDDPIFRLTFPQRAMLSEEHFNCVADQLRAGADPAALARVADAVRRDLNPHPAGQLECNVPSLLGVPVPGVQHKYPETVLVFPAPGQTCQAFCTFCFRWPQFVPLPGFRFAARQAGLFADYIRSRSEVTDVLLTGGDPLVASCESLRPYVEPLLTPAFSHVTTIRIGTKSLAYWPYRFLTDSDAGDLLGLFERVVAAGKHLAVMAHFTHPRELEPPAVREAIRRIRATGAEVRTQAPLLRGINDTAETWAEMWKTEVRLGCVPYYMFLVRDTGARPCFEVPLERAWQIFRRALQSTSGLVRTVRGPVMSTHPGKIVVDGVARVLGHDVFVLSFIQARQPAWVKQPFFATFDPDATWFTDLRPAWHEPGFFFEQGPGESSCAA